MTQARDVTPAGKSTASELAASVRKGLMLGAAVLVLVLPPAVSLLPGSSRPAATTRAGAPAAPLMDAWSGAPQSGGAQASPPVLQMARWVVASGDHGHAPFVIVDKRDAQVFVFDARGHLKAATAALLGAASGDDSAPGIGEKPLSQVLPEEKTTPAGRFVAELGLNTKGEDIVWVDYDAAVSMHRVRANVKSERRLERLASATPADNRISFGCINLPVRFYEDVLKPTVQAGTTVIYVLPETRPIQEVFASYREPEAPLKVNVGQRAL